jgi:putative flippase GtrA
MIEADKSDADERGQGCRSVVYEFIRYAVVGGVAFLADIGALVLFQELFFGSLRYGLYLSTVAGFIVGLVVNYVLSLKFVFTQEKDRGKGRSAGAFIVFGIIGLFGLLWTELGMWAGVEILSCDYRIVKVLVTGMVLVWNYLGRKLLIFNSRA